MTEGLHKESFEIFPSAVLSDKLSLVASKGQIDKVQELLHQSGAKFDADQEGRTALHYAALNGYKDICWLLISNGCAIDHQDVVGFTALHRACSQGHSEVCRVLLEAGCSRDFQDEHGNTALHEAAWNGFSKTLEVLIKFNCNVSIVNKSGFTALHLAAQNGHNESSRVLIYAGCLTDAKNNYGDTALHTAARYGHAGVTRIFISARCALNEQNKNGDSPLHIAAALKRRKITKLLVEAGIDPFLRNKQNESAIDVAQRKEYPEIVHLITTHSKQKTYGQPSVNVSTERPSVSFEGKKIANHFETKPTKEKRFFFFKRKKKNKEIPASQTQMPSNVALPMAKRPDRTTGKTQPVQGFFNKYVPKEGVQYYRDLAGNIKQGPIGYTPICQCIPVVKRLEKSLDETCENIYEQIDASHQILENRINQLDKRTAQQVLALDHLANGRLNPVYSKCQLKCEGPTEGKQYRARYNDNIKSELQAYLEAQSSDDDGESYHPHHHDDSGFYHRSVFFNINENENGRLFRSRSDETLSQSDYSARHRKKDFYENRQAAMQHIRAWQTSDRNLRREGRSYKVSPTKEADTKRHRTTPQIVSANGMQSKEQPLPILKSPNSDYVSHSNFQLCNIPPSNVSPNYQPIPRSTQPSHSPSTLNLTSSVQNSTLLHNKSDKGHLVSPRIEPHTNPVRKPLEKQSQFLEKDFNKKLSQVDGRLNPKVIYSSASPTPKKYDILPTNLKADPESHRPTLKVSNYTTMTKPSVTKRTQPYQPSSLIHNHSLTKKDEGIVTGRSRSQDHLLDPPPKELFHDDQKMTYDPLPSTSLSHSKSHNNILKESISDNSSHLTAMHSRSSFKPYSPPVGKNIPSAERTPPSYRPHSSSYSRFSPSTNSPMTPVPTDSNHNNLPRSVSTNKHCHLEDYQSLSMQSSSYTPPYKDPPPYHSTRTLPLDVEGNIHETKVKPWSRESLGSQGVTNEVSTGNTSLNFQGKVPVGNYGLNNQVHLVTSSSAAATSLKLIGMPGKTLKKDPVLSQLQTGKTSSSDKFSPLSIEPVPQVDASPNKEDSSSNPDSGYSSRIYGTNLDASNRSSSTLLNSVHSGLPSPSSFSGTDQSFCISPTNLSPHHDHSPHNNQSSKCSNGEVGAANYENQTNSNKQYFESVAAHLQSWYHKKKQENLQRDTLQKKSPVIGLQQHHLQQQQQQKSLSNSFDTNVYSIDGTNAGQGYIRGSDV